MKLTHTEYRVQALLLFFFWTHTQVTVRLSSLFKCSEKQSTAGVKGAVSNTVLSCKNGVRIPESQRHCSPLHYWIISFSKENLSFSFLHSDEICNRLRLLKKCKTSIKDVPTKVNF